MDTHDGLLIPEEFYGTVGAALGVLIAGIIAFTLSIDSIVYASLFGVSAAVVGILVGEWYAGRLPP